MALEPEYTSSPTRNPRFHPSFSVQPPDWPADQELHFFTHAFYNYYAGNHWLRRIMEDTTDCTESWKDEYTLVLTHKSGIRLCIREHNLQDVIEYEPNKEELAWRPNYPASAELERLTKFWDWPPLRSFQEPSSKDDEPNEAPPERITKAPKRHKSTKPAPSGDLITVAQIAESLDIQPNKARNILRKASIKKPEGGWTFKKNDPMIETITELLKKG